MGDKKIYHSFEELLEKNSSFFHFMEKHVSLELLRAVWNARQGEVEQLKKERDAREGHRQVLERELVERKRLAEEREKSMGELRERLVLLEMELEIGVREWGEMKDEMALVGEEARELTQERDSLRESCTELEKTLAAKCRQWEEQLQLCRKQEKALKSERAYMRTQKALNEKMSAELLRLTPVRQDSV